MRELLQYSRPQSMYDSEIHRYLGECTRSGDNFGDDPPTLFSSFKNK